MTTSLKRYDPPADIMQLGAVLKNSGFFDDVKSEAQAIVKVMAGAEMGVGPIAAMAGIHVIKGKVTVGANLIAAAIKRSGRYDYRVIEMSNTACEIQFYEQGQKVGVSRFTEGDAKAAGTQNMSRFPRNMLFARALSNGARWYTPDVFGGPIYTPEEMGAQVDEDGDVLAIPEDLPQQRRAPVVRDVTPAAVATFEPAQADPRRKMLIGRATAALRSPRATEMERDLDLDTLSDAQLDGLISEIRLRGEAGVNDELFDD
jgi:hypothetical protein